MFLKPQISVSASKIQHQSDDTRNSCGCTTSSYDTSIWCPTLENTVSSGSRMEYSMGEEEHNSVGEELTLLQPEQRDTCTEPWRTDKYQHTDELR